MPKGALRGAAVATAVGGAFWVAKGAFIIATGAQPAYLFEVAPIGFALGLVALHAVYARNGTLDWIAGASAYAALALAVAAAAAFLLVPEALSDEGSFSPWSLLPLGNMLLTLVALILVGIRIRASNRLTSMRGFPLVFGILMVPIVVGGVLLEPLHERLVEVPVVLVGAGWMLIGWLVWKSAPARDV